MWPLYRLFLLPLAPVLLWQGKRLRSSMPHLPEPNGEREGELGQGPLLRVLIVGDSAAAGVGCEQQNDALSGQVIGVLKKNYRLSWRLIAKSGINCAQCFKHLSTLTPQHYDVAIVSIGVNDATGQTTATQWQQQLSRLTTILTNDYGVKQVIYSKIPPFAQFRVLKQPLRWYLGDKAGHFNALLSKHVNKNPNTTLVELGDRLTANDLASDGFHPSATIYRQWAQLIATDIIQRHKEQI